MQNREDAAFDVRTLSNRKAKLTGGFCDTLVEKFSKDETRDDICCCIV